MSLWENISSNNAAKVKEIVDKDKSLAYSIDDNGMTTLIASAKVGSLELMQYFAKLGIDPKAMTPNGSDILIASATAGSLECFEFSLNLGADINRKRDDGTTVMIFAAMGGNPQIIQKCIEAGLDVNEKSKGLSTPLIEASKKGSLESCKLLIEKGADVNAKQKSGFSPLIGSCLSGNFELFSYLCGLVNIDEYKNSKIIHEAVIGNNENIVEFLISKKFDVNQKVKGRLPIHIAFMKGNLKIVRLLVENGAKLDKCDVESTPLHYAAESDNVETFNYILSQMPDDINSRNALGMTPILQAAATHSFDVCKYLIAKGGNIFEKDNKGQNILHFASTHCKSDLLETLDLLGLDFNEKDSNGRSPLFCAVEAGNLDAIKFFVEEKFADVKEIDNYGINLFHVVANKLPVCEYLLEQGVDPTVLDESNRSPLHYAAESGKFNIIQFLLDHGCSAVTKDANEMTPIDIASDFGHIEIFEILVDSVPVTDENKDKPANE